VPTRTAVGQQLCQNVGSLVTKDATAQNLSVWIAKNICASAQNGCARHQADGTSQHETKTLQRLGILVTRADPLKLTETGNLKTDRLP
jgi:hypothetical protein